MINYYYYFFDFASLIFVNLFSDVKFMIQNALNDTILRLCCQILDHVRTVWTASDGITVLSFVDVYKP